MGPGLTQPDLEFQILLSCQIKFDDGYIFKMHVTLHFM